MEFLKYILLGILPFSFFPSLAQNEGDCNHVLTGQILDVDTKEPLPYVSVKIKGVEQFAITDVEGRFEIKGLCSEKNTLIISCFGYCDAECEENHQHGREQHIYLKKELLELNEVLITTEQDKSTGIKSSAIQSLEVKELITNSSSLAAVLSKIEGVSLLSTGSNVQLPIIHGLYGNRILILNNGVKHGFQNWGSDHAPEIDIANAHKISVIKGAGAVKYGPDAMGGAIVVESNPLYLNEKFHADMGSGFQSNGRGYFSKFSVFEGREQFSYHISGNFSKIGDRHAPNYVLNNTGKEEWALSAGLRYHLSDWDFKFYFSHVDQNLGLLQASAAESSIRLIELFEGDHLDSQPFSYEVKEPNQLTSHQLAKAEINWWYADEGKLTFTAAHQLNRREEYDVRRNSGKPINDLNLITQDYQLEWKHPDWLRLDGIVGLQYFSQTNSNNYGTGSPHVIPNYTSTRFSAFLMESITSGKNTFEMGLRLDSEHNDVAGREHDQTLFRDQFTLSNVSASLGWLRELSDDATFRSNIGMAWRAPNIAELFTYGYHNYRLSFGLLRQQFDTEKNEYVNLVRTWSGSDIEAEKGLKWVNEWLINSKKSSYRLTAYGHYIQNFIFERPIGARETFFATGASPYYIFDQADGLFLGMDVTWKKNWNEQWTGTLGMSYLWSKNVAKNEPLINQVPNNINYELSYELPKILGSETSQLSIRPSYTFRQYQAPPTITMRSIAEKQVDITEEKGVFILKDAPQGYALVDLAWRWQSKKIKIDLAVNNAFNVSYRDYLNEMRFFANEPGRNFLLSFNYSFN